MSERVSAREVDTRGVSFTTRHRKYTMRHMRTSGSHRSRTWGIWWNRSPTTLASAFLAESLRALYASVVRGDSSSRQAWSAASATSICWDVGSAVAIRS